MSALTDYAEKRALDYLFTGSVYVELHTGDPGEDATANKVTTSNDADYVRKIVTMAATTLGTGISLSSTAVTWTVNTASAGYTVTHISLWDALTAGNALMKGALISPAVLVGDDVFTIAAGQIVAQLD